MIVYVWFRWMVLTVRRYGWFSLTTGTRPRHAGVGHGTRRNAFGRAHHSGGSVAYLVRILAQERALRPLTAAA